MKKFRSLCPAGCRARRALGALLLLGLALMIWLYVCGGESGFIPAEDYSIARSDTPAGSLEEINWRREDPGWGFSWELPETAQLTGRSGREDSPGLFYMVHFSHFKSLAKISVGLDNAPSGTDLRALRGSLSADWLNSGEAKIFKAALLSGLESTGKTLDLESSLSLIDVDGHQAIYLSFAYTHSFKDGSFRYNIPETGFVALLPLEDRLAAMHVSFSHMKTPEQKDFARGLFRRFLAGVKIQDKLNSRRPRPPAVFPAPGGPKPEVSC